MRVPALTLSKLVVVPAVFDEWDVPEGASVESSVPAWARPDPVKDPYVVSDLYQRRFEAAPGFVQSSVETAVYLKFVVDHYENLPDVTAFVRGDFHRDVADAKQRLVRVANRAAGVAYQPLDIPETTKDGVEPALRTRRVSPPGELVQMWKDERWGWEGIMGDTAGAAAAHVSRCWRGLVDEFGEFTVDEKEEEETRVADVGRARCEREARVAFARGGTRLRQSELGRFFYPRPAAAG